jgi:hypothetical protein
MRINSITTENAITELKTCAENLGYELSDSDCLDIIETSFNGETVLEAINDYLDAYER